MYIYMYIHTYMYTSIYITIYIICIYIYNIHIYIPTVSAFYINVIYILKNQGDISFKSVIFGFLRIFNEYI